MCFAIKVFKSIDINKNIKRLNMSSKIEMLSLEELTPVDYIYRKLK
jgi:hypothetical protein